MSGISFQDMTPQNKGQGASTMNAKGKYQDATSRAGTGIQDALSADDTFEDSRTAQGHYDPLTGKVVTDNESLLSEAFGAIGDCFRPAQYQDLQGQGPTATPPATGSGVVGGAPQLPVTV